MPEFLAQHSYITRSRCRTPETYVLWISRNVKCQFDHTIAGGLTARRRRPMKDNCDATAELCRKNYPKTTDRRLLPTGVRHVRRGAVTVRRQARIPFITMQSPTDAASPDIATVLLRPKTDDYQFDDSVSLVGRGLTASEYPPKPRVDDGVRRGLDEISIGT